MGEKEFLAVERELLAMLRAVLDYRRYRRYAPGEKRYPQESDALLRVALDNALVRIRKPESA
jgi:hypothetical protein